MMVYSIKILFMAMYFDYDVCVIGAGPVGSTISYYLSLKGLSVVLLDKKTKIS